MVSTIPILPYLVNPCLSRKIIADHPLLRIRPGHHQFDPVVGRFVGPRGEITQSETPALPSGS